MRQTEIELLWAWFTNEAFRIDAELNECRQRVRFRNIDINDNVEMMLLLQRQSDFKEFSNTAIRLLNLDLESHSN